MRTKALAKKNGTYYQGTAAFNASNQLPNGIVFIDTVSGKQYRQKRPEHDAHLRLCLGDHQRQCPARRERHLQAACSSWRDRSRSTAASRCTGWSTCRTTSPTSAPGAGQITGAVLSQNIRDTSATSIDTDTGGNSTIIWNCDYAKNGGGYLPPTFTD